MSNVIRLTKFDGSPILINFNLVQTVEQLPVNDAGLHGSSIEFEVEGNVAVHVQESIGMIQTLLSSLKG